MANDSDLIAVLNAGSSSIKFSTFAGDAPVRTERERPVLLRRRTPRHDYDGSATLFDCHPAGNTTKRWNG